MDWIKEFKNAYQMLKDKLYLANGSSYKLSHSGNTDYDNIDLLSLKLEVDKNKNEPKFNYRYWTRRIYNLLRIKIEVFEWGI